MSFDVTNWDFDAYCAEQVVWFPDLPASLAFLGPSGESLPAFLRAKLVEGLSLMKSLPEADPFWRKSHIFNRLPTIGKLAEYAESHLRAAGVQPRFAWYLLAVGVRFCASPHVPNRIIPSGG